MSAKYVLHYWPVIPGRGEFVRLAFESVRQPYSEKHDPVEVSMKSNKQIGHPPHFAPPVLEVIEAREGATSPTPAFISQTPAILAYLGSVLHLDGVPQEENGGKEDEQDGLIRRAQVQQITMTILDLNNETHDVHHPVSAGAYYEEQKEEAKRRAIDFRSSRIPKFFSLFELTIKSNPHSSGWLFGPRFTIADLALFQVVDGLHFAFPRLMSALKSSGKFDLVFGLREKMASVDTIKAYLQSKRRKEYSNGVFRHYPELDDDK